MSEERTIALRFMDALWAGDEAAVFALLSKDATWRFQPTMPQAADGERWPAREAFRSIVALFFDKFDPDGFGIKVLGTVAEGGTVVIEYASHGRTARGTDYRNVYAAALDIADGKIVDVRPYNDTKLLLSLLN